MTLLKSYGFDKYDVITNNYDENGQVYFTTYNGLGYTLSRDVDGDLLSVAVNGKNLLENKFAIEGKDEESYNEQTSTMFANGQGEIYEYKTISVTGADGLVTNENVLKGIKVDGATSYSYEYEYNSDGNIFKLHDYVNEVCYTYLYDENGEVSEIKADNGFSVKKEVDSETDKKKIVYHIGDFQHSIVCEEQSNRNGTIVHSEIDNNIVVTEKKEGGLNQSKVVTYRGNEVFKNQINVSYEKINVISGDKTIEYFQDDWGNITSISRSGKIKEKQTYEYDEREQLIKETNSEFDDMIAYEYDANGNRTSQKEYTASGKLKNTITYTYDNSWRDVLASYTQNGVKEMIVSDACGNPQNWMNGWTFTWKDGRLLEKAENQMYEICYKYNIMGMRTQKKVVHKSTNMETVYDYIWDGNYPVRETRTTENGKITIDYLYDGNYDSIGFQVSGNKELAGMYLFEKDLQDNVIAIYEVADTLKKCVAEYAYDAYGNQVKITNHTSQKIGELNPYRYRSYYQDEETSFYYLQSRYYDAKVGRFLNMDNILYLGIDTNVYNNSYNLFGYCENNPVNYSDSTGTKPTKKQMIKFVNKYMGGWYNSFGKQVFYWGYHSPQSVAGYCDVYDNVARLAGANISTVKITCRNGKNWRFQFWKGSYAYGYMYGGEIGIYYNNKSGSKGWFASAKPYPIKMSYTLYNSKGRALYSTRSETTWWKNGFAFQTQYGFYNKNNLKMIANLYFPKSTVGTQQKNAFLSKKRKVEYSQKNSKCNILKSGNSVTVHWGW